VRPKIQSASYFNPVAGALAKSLHAMHIQKPKFVTTFAVGESQFEHALRLASQ
jgi:hypothetical protein